MKRYLSIFIAGALLLSLLTACEKEEPDPGDVFVRETDCPLSTFTGIDDMYLAAGEDGYYMQVGAFLFYLDRETLQMVPLCNRPNCLHDKETDAMEVWKCNAYLGNGAPLLQFYQGKLYAMSYFNADAVGNKNISQLVELSPDGSSRKPVLDIPGQAYPRIHRGYIYYEQMDKDVEQIARRPLNDPEAEAEILFEGGEDSNAVSIDGVYGNHIYIENLRLDRPNRSYFQELYDYNIKTGEITQIIVEKDSGLPLDISLKAITGQGTLIVTCHHPSTIEYDSQTGEVLDMGDIGSVYTVDLNHHVEYLMNCRIDDFIATLDVDDTYLYQYQINSGVGYSTDMEFQKQKKLYIRDKDLNVVSEVSMGQIGYLYETCSIDDRYIFVTQIAYNTDDSYWCFVLDKETIGSGEEEFVKLFNIPFEAVNPGVVYYSG